jgi:hypothetical protein
MKTTNIMISLIFIASLSACGKSESTQTKLFETQRNALDQAKQVDQKMQQQTQQLQQNMDKQAQ